MTDDTNHNGPDAGGNNKAEQSAKAEHNNSVEAENFIFESDPLEALRLENAELKDRFLRLAADMDNLRRRTEREIKDAKTYAVTGFARDMLAVSDNLRRAIDAIPPEARAAGEAGFMTLVEGVELTERSMLNALERHGVKKIDPVGEKFDPNFHQAMFEIPNPEVPNNTVIQVVQSGYMIGDRVLRPAMVGVAKGGSKMPANDSEIDDTAQSA